jgi:ankyrin repeat protein
VRSGLTDFAELLAKYGAPRTTSAPDPFDEFQAACMRLDRGRAEALLSEHPEFLANPAPLFTAAEHDLVAVARLLLDLGMSPDTPNAAAGNTRALHLAAYNDSRRVATLLVERGATIDPRDDTHESTPIFWAHWGGKPQMVDLLARVSRDIWALAAAGKVDRLREVLAAEPYRAKAGGRDHALLFYLPNDERAAVEVARLLLAAGADPTVIRTDGVTPEQAARVRGLDAAADVIAAQPRAHLTVRADGSHSL